MRFDTKKKETFASTVITITSLCLISISLAVICYITCCQAKNMNRESLNEFVKKYPKLYEGLKIGENSKIKRLTIVWKPLNLLRLLLTYVILLTLKKYPVLQIMFLLVISVLQ